jgi:hypothetical protein
MGGSRDFDTTVKPGESDPKVVPTQGGQPSDVPGGHPARLNPVTSEPLFRIRS